MKHFLVRSMLFAAIAGSLFVGDFAYAWSFTDKIQSLGNWFDSAVTSIASDLGFSSTTQKSLTSGGYRYYPSHGGLNAYYVDVQGDILTIDYCDNGAYVATKQTVCSSSPNSCGMVGTGFITDIISHERRVASSHSGCSANTPSDSLCSVSGNAGASSNTNTNQNTGQNQNNNSGPGENTDQNTNEGKRDGSSCSVGYICQAGTLYLQNTDCSLNYADNQECPAGCTTGRKYCSTPKPPSITAWQVRPTLVRSGGTVHITWGAQNVKSCTVTGNNLDGTAQSKDQDSPGIWSGSNGDVVSSPILGQVTYTIVCIGYPGATPLSTEQSTVVDIAPIHHEQ